MKETTNEIFDVDLFGKENAKSILHRMNDSLHITRICQSSVVICPFVVSYLLFP